MTDLEGRALDEALARAIGRDIEVLPEHRWKLRKNGEVDDFAYNAGDYHNGPQCERCGYGYCEHCQDEASELCEPLILSYHASLDALLRDIEPVCRERGMSDWRLETGEDEDGGGYDALILCSEDNYVVSFGRYAPTAATALARAFLAVLTRGER